MSPSGSDGQLRTLVALLLLVQFVSVFLAWSMNPLGANSQLTFALLLALNLVAFSAVSYANRVSKWGLAARGSVLLAASVVLLLMMLLVLLF